MGQTSLLRLLRVQPSGQHGDTLVSAQPVLKMRPPPKRDLPDSKCLLRNTISRFKMNCPNGSIGLDNGRQKRYIGLRTTDYCLQCNLNLFINLYHRTIEEV